MAGKQNVQSAAAPTGERHDQGQSGGASGAGSGTTRPRRALLEDEELREETEPPRPAGDPLGEVAIEPRRGTPSGPTSAHR